MSKERVMMFYTKFIGINVVILEPLQFFGGSKLYGLLSSASSILQALKEYSLMRFVFGLLYFNYKINHFKINHP